MSWKSPNIGVKPSSFRLPSGFSAFMRSCFDEAVWNSQASAAEEKI